MSAAKSGERAENFLVSDLGTALVRAGVSAPTDPSTIGRAVFAWPSREPPARTKAAERGKQSDLRASARSRVVCARAAPDRVFLSLTPSHFFSAVGNGCALGS